MPITRQVAQAIGSRDARTCKTYLSDPGVTVGPPTSRCTSTRHCPAHTSAISPSRRRERRCVSGNTRRTAAPNPRGGSHAGPRTEARPPAHRTRTTGVAPSASADGPPGPAPGTRRPARRVCGTHTSPFSRPPATASPRRHITGGARLGAAGQAAVYAGCPCRPLPAGNRYFRVACAGAAPAGYLASSTSLPHPDRAPKWRPDRPRSSAPRRAGVPGARQPAAPREPAVNPRPGSAPLPGDAPAVFTAKLVYPGGGPMWGPSHLPSSYPGSPGVSPRRSLRP